MAKLATTEFKGGRHTSSYVSGPAAIRYNWDQNNGPIGSQRGSPGSGTAGGGVDPLALSGAISDLLGFEADAAQYKAAAEGSRLDAEGAALEADAYRIAGGIAGENQRVEAMSESVRQIQIQKQVDQTIGAQKARTAANGFQLSGSSLDIMASSTREGLLSQQISGVQSQQTQSGYLAQAAAAEGEMKAAGVRGSAATKLSEAQDAAGGKAIENQTALSGALTQLLSGDPNAQKLVDDIMAGDTSAVQADVLLYNPGGDALATATPEKSFAETNKPYNAQTHSSPTTPLNQLGVWG